MSNGESHVSASALTAGALLILVTALLYFYKLGEAEVGSEAQARVLLTAQDMSRHQTWLVPTAGGDERWEKPPLYVWAVRLVSILSHEEITPLIARIPGAVSILLMVLLAAWWCYQHQTRYPRADSLDFKPEGFALLAGLMVASSPETFLIAREGVPDSLFALLCFGALYCFGESFETRRSFYAGRPWRQWVLLGYLLIGLATMTKGPAAFLFVLIPTIATCWSYKMRRPDWIHLPGMALALIVGGWWYATALKMDPAAASIFFAELLTRRLGPHAAHRGPIWFYLTRVIYTFFPWILIALAMAWRNFRHIERTPTTLTWSWSVVASMFWLSLVQTKRMEYFLPVAPAVLLLAGDGLARWNFNSKPGTLFWILLRALRWGVIIFAIPYCLFVFPSDAGVWLAIALGVLSLIFLWHRRHTTYTYEVWERTVQAAALLLVVALCIELVYINDYIPRKGFLSRGKAFAARVEAHLPPSARLYFYGTEDSALNSYLMGELLPITHNVGKLIEAEAGSEVYLVSDSKIGKLKRDPRLAEVVAKRGGKSMRTRAALFKVLTNLKIDPDGPGPTLAERYAEAPPLRIAVLGDAARGDWEAQKDMAKRLNKFNESNPYHEIIMLGDFVAGESRLARLHFSRSFERPYKRLLESGASFNGVLGKLDQEIVKALLNYRILQMADGRRYYARVLYGGVAELFVLDSKTLSEGKEHPQWDWLERKLAESQSIWKIVILHKPVLSFAKGEKNDRDVANLILPMLDFHEVELVLWASEPWYQRVHDPDHYPLFVGTGFGGRVKHTRFPPDQRIQSVYMEKPGFVSLEITPAELRLTASNIDGETVDECRILPDGKVEDLEF